MIKIHAEEPFKILYNLPPGTNTVICIGGRGGMKTYEVSKFACVSATVRRKRVAVLRDEQAKIKQSILNEVMLRYDTANEYGGLDRFFHKQDTVIKDRLAQKDVVFTMGFRMSSNDRKAGLKSVSDVDIAVIEEAEDIRDVSKYNSFSDSIRKEGHLIIIILNTPDIHHWIIKRYFHLEAVPGPDGEPLDGYFKIVPKNIPGFVCIQTSFEDNHYLPASKVAEYRGYGDPAHHLYDLHHYYTDILGYASTGRRGQVFKKVQRITLAEYLALDAKEIFGLDFGTSSPAGIVAAKLIRNDIYVRELSYRPMEVLEIGKFLCGLKLTDEDLVVADSASPLDIGLLRRGWQPHEISAADAEAYPDLLRGFYVMGVAKPPGSVNSGVSILKGMGIYITDDSANFWEVEVINYVYAQDKYGNYTGDPVDGFNHLWDPTRYIAQSRGRLF